METVWVVEWKYKDERGAKWMASLWVTFKQIAKDYVAERSRENPDIQYRIREDKAETQAQA